jgi:hypothetical protein
VPGLSLLIGNALDRALSAMELAGLEPATSRVR